LSATDSEHRRKRARGRAAKPQDIREHQVRALRNADLVWHSHANRSPEHVNAVGHECAFNAEGTAHREDRDSVL
jgi:hypothetical protein